MTTITRSLLVGPGLGLWAMAAGAATDADRCQATKLTQADTRLVPAQGRGESGQAWWPAELLPAELAEAHRRLQDVGCQPRGQEHD